MEIKKETDKKWKRIAHVHEYGFFSQPDGIRKEFDRIHEYHRSGIDFCDGEYTSHSAIEKS